MTASAQVSESARIIWAIATKDIVDALKNKVIIALVFGLAFLMLSAQAFPLLMKMSGTTMVIVYDDADSGLVQALADSEDYRVVEARSRQEMEDLLVETGGAALAVVVPAGTEQALASGGQPELAGYVAWASRASAKAMGADLERRLAEVLGQSVRVRVEGNIIFPPPEGAGELDIIAMVMVTFLMTIGTFLIPNLMFEEKQAHTMEALLISPASLGQVVTGKALVGLFYSLVTMAVVMAFNYATVAHWGPAVLATLCGAILFAGLGLALGMLFETPQQMGGWVTLPFLVLLLPMMLSMMGTLPEPLATMVAWLPTMALGRLFLASFSNSAVWAQNLLDLSIVLVWAIPAYAAATWLLRRMDR
jgi:ABC-2 type transport system permease protein